MKEDIAIRKDTWRQSKSIEKSWNWRQIYLTQRLKFKKGSLTFLLPCWRNRTLRPGLAESGALHLLCGFQRLLIPLGRAYLSILTVYSCIRVIVPHISPFVHHFFYKLDPPTLAFSHIRLPLFLISSSRYVSLLLLKVALFSMCLLLGTVWS
jgi:hypothetical protein